MLPAALLWLWLFKAGASSQVTGRGDASAEFGGDAQYQYALADSTGVRGRIETQQTVMAELGHQAQISCELLETRDVLQVTWQKVRGQGEVHLASYSEFFGTKVNAGFEGKVEVKPGLQSSSLVVRNLTEQDEGCYLCLFHTYPDGDITGKSCLRLYELHEPRLDLRDSNRTVSCSVTGRPAVTVSLNVSGCDLSSPHTSTSIINADGTVSSSSHVE